MHIIYRRIALLETVSSENAEKKSESNGSSKSSLVNRTRYQTENLHTSF